MRCIYCDSSESRVVDTAKVEKKVIRERVCQSCYKRFWTEETSPVNTQAFLMKQLRKSRSLAKK